MKYIRNLHNIDDRVSSVSPQIGKQHRIYVGTVVGCNNRKYLILLSHPVEKHKRMSPRADFDKIIDKKGKLLGELNYNLMIPVDDKQLIKVDLKENKKDTPAESHYKQLCIDELTWCMNRALGVLKFSSKEAAARVEKLLRSAIANWEQKNERKAESGELFVTKIFVDGGATLKRMRPAPQGRGYRIRKRSNHVTLFVGSKSNNEDQN